MFQKILKISSVICGILIVLFGCKGQNNQRLVLIEGNHNLYYSKGTALIQPYIELADRIINIDSKAKDSILEGIRYLDAVTKINPNNYAAYWVKGKGYQSLKQHDSAYLQFSKSFKLKKGNPDIARELTIECLYLGKGEEGVNAAMQALSFDTSNAGLIGNLALSYLIKGDIDLANKTIKKAIEKDPKDEINLMLVKVINEVISGKRNKPQKYDDIKL